MTFAERLKEALVAKEVTQKELAKALDVTPSTVNRWLSGTFEPRDIMVSNIASVLGCDYLYLAKGDGEAEEDPVGEPVEEGPSYEELKAKADLYEKLYYDLLDRMFGGRSRR